MEQKKGEGCMKKKKRFLLVVVLAFVLSACAIKGKDEPKEQKQVGNTQEENIQEENEDVQKPDPGTPDPELSSKPLEFFDASFHDEEGFTFDGFSLLDEYEGLEERLELTEGSQIPKIQETKEGDIVITNVVFPMFELEQNPDVGGRVEYRFYNRKFFNGKMELEFLSYEDAREYIRQKVDGISAYRDTSYEERQNETGETDGGWWVHESEEIGKSFDAVYVDQFGAALQFHAEIKEETGIVTVTYMENLNFTLPGTREKSVFFEEEETV